MRKLIVFAAVTALSVAGVCVFANSRAANPEFGREVSIDSWQLHLTTDIKNLPTLTIADVV